jgi:hypothetical protein
LEVISEARVWRVAQCDDVVSVGADIVDRIRFDLGGVGDWVWVWG